MQIHCSNDTYLLIQDAFMARPNPENPSTEKYIEYMNREGHLDRDMLEAFSPSPLLNGGTTVNYSFGFGAPVGAQTVTQQVS